MKNSFISEHLISDLICLYNKTGEQRYLMDLKNRFKFCGFTDKETEEFLKFETYISELKENKYEKLILKKYWLVGKELKRDIFDDEQKYTFNPGKDNSNILLTSEIMAIIDEAVVLSYSNYINKYISKNRILEIAKEESSNWLFREFKSRIEFICRIANNVKASNKKMLYSEKVDNLYWNENAIMYY